ncbi:MAG: hypothetical protein V4610_15615 [Pseudomonadota bacterium]
MIAILLLEPVLTVPAFKIFAMTGISRALLQDVVVASAGSAIFDGRRCQSTRLAAQAAPSVQMAPYRPIPRLASVVTKANSP